MLGQRNPVVKWTWMPTSSKLGRQVDLGIYTHTCIYIQYETLEVIGISLEYIKKACFFNKSNKHFFFVPGLTDNYSLLSSTPLEKFV